MSDPFAHHPLTENLDSTATITPVTVEVMSHAGEQAARLLQTISPVRRKKAGKPIVAAAPAPAADIPVLLESHISDPSLQAEAVEAPQDEAIIEPPIEAMQPIEPTLDSVPEPIPTVIETVADELPLLAAEVSPVDEDPVDPEPLPADAPVLTIMAEEVAEEDAVAAFRSRFTKVFHSNVEASLSFFMAMTRVTSPAEAIQLNSEHLRKQMESFMTQSHDLSVLAQKAMTVSMGTLARSFGQPQA